MAGMLEVASGTPQHFYEHKERAARSAAQE